MHMAGSLCNMKAVVRSFTSSVVVNTTSGAFESLPLKRDGPEA